MLFPDDKWTEWTIIIDVHVPNKSDPGYMK